MIERNESDDYGPAVIAAVVVVIAATCAAAYQLSQAWGVSFASAINFVAWMLSTTLLVGGIAWFTGMFLLPTGLLLLGAWRSTWPLFHSWACGGCNPEAQSSIYLPLDAPWYDGSLFHWGVLLLLLIFTVVFGLIDFGRASYRF